MGRHSIASCIHHGANIEVLCHECHVAEHGFQRKSRRRVPGYEDAQLTLTVYDARDLAQPR